MRYGVEYAEQEREWTRSENAPGSRLLKLRYLTGMPRGTT